MRQLVSHRRRSVRPAGRRHHENGLRLGTRGRRGPPETLAGCSQLAPATLAWNARCGCQWSSASLRASFDNMKDIAHARVKLVAREARGSRVENPFLQSPASASFVRRAYTRGWTLTLPGCANRSPDLRIQKSGLSNSTPTSPRDGQSVGAAHGGLVSLRSRVRTVAVSGSLRARQWEPVRSRNREASGIAREAPSARTGSHRPPRSPPAPIAPLPACTLQPIEPGVWSSCGRSFRVCPAPLHALGRNKSPAAWFVKAHSERPLNGDDFHVREYRYWPVSSQ